MDLPPTLEGVYTVIATVTDPNYSGTVSGTFTIVNSARALRLSWSATDAVVSVDQSNDLVHWLPLATSPGGDGGLTLSQESDSLPHFFRASATTSNGRAFLPITLQYPSALGGE